MAQSEVAGFTEAIEPLLAVGQYEEAYRLAKDAIAAHPDAYYPYCLAARAQSGSHGPQAAELFLKKALERGPVSPCVHRLVSANYDAMAGQRRGYQRDDILLKALGHAEEAVRLAPQDASSLAQLANVQGELDYFDKAGPTLARAIELAPGSAQVWATASNVAILARNWRAAELAARRCLAIDPGRPEVQNRLGIALRRQGKSVLGLIAFGDAAAKGPNVAQVRRNLERAGFEVLRSFGSYLLLPLLLFPPVMYWAARAARYAHYSRRPRGPREPERLRPLARWVGLRIAHSALLRGHFERMARRTLKQLEAEAGWSLSKNPLRVLSGWAMLASCLVVGAVAFIGAFQVAARVSGGWRLPAVLGFLALCLAALKFLWRRGGGRI
ncbi:MAG TPA: hypothetical protein VFN61_01110 [Acidimicrobiales bacterium]|nr:hypothetical protein [Acidimicrobiales bacterium]